MPLGEVVGGPQSCLPFDLFMELQTGNSLYLFYLVLWVISNFIFLTSKKQAKKSPTVEDVF